MTPTPDITSQEALSPVGEGSAVGHTPGPWAVSIFTPAAVVAVHGEELVSNVALALQRQHELVSRDFERQANARLIAAAPDHALICWAMCVGAGRWEAWGDGRGEFCMNGLRHATRLDEFGCPIPTDAMRAAIAKAGGRL